MSISLLAAALRRIGVEGEVDSIDGIAVLTTANPEKLADPQHRELAVAIAKEHGFGSLAVEVARTAGADLHRG
jgi:hypothetical protein